MCGIQFSLLSIWRSFVLFRFKVQPTPIVITQPAMQDHVSLLGAWAHCGKAGPLLTVTKPIQAPTSPPSGNHAKLASVPSPFWILNQTVYLYGNLICKSFFFFLPQPLGSLPIKTAWFLRLVSSHVLPLDIRRWRAERAFYPPPLLKSWPLLSVFPDHAADTQNLIQSQISDCNSRVGKNGAKIKIRGFHTFLWPHQKYWLEIQRVVKLTVEQSQKSSGQHWGIPTMRVSFCPLTKVYWLQLKPVRDSTLTLSTNIREQGATVTTHLYLGQPLGSSGLCNIGYEIINRGGLSTLEGLSRRVFQWCHVDRNCCGSREENHLQFKLFSGESSFSVRNLESPFFHWGMAENAA